MPRDDVFSSIDTISLDINIYSNKFLMFKLFPYNVSISWATITIDKYPIF